MQEREAKVILVSCRAVQCLEYAVRMDLQSPQRRCQWGRGTGYSLCVLEPYYVGVKAVCKVDKTNEVIKWFVLFCFLMASFTETGICLKLR